MHDSLSTHTSVWVYDGIRKMVPSHTSLWENFDYLTIKVLIKPLSTANCSKSIHSSLLDVKIYD